MARRPHRMTPKRRAALRKAQLASARKRRRNKVIKRTAIAAGAVAVVGGAAYGRHRMSGSSLTVRRHPVVGVMSGNVSGSRGRSVRHSRLTQRSSGLNRKRVLGHTVTYSSAKRGPLGNSYSVSYEHKHLRKEVVKKKSTVLGRKISGAPKRVVDRRPLNTRKMQKHNRPFTEEAMQSARQYGATRQRYAHLRVSEAEAMRRTNSYVGSLRRPPTAARADRIRNYYRQQQRFDATLNPLPRGRRRSRELRRKRK